mmetsp:Transcript_10030/g.30678  ORF Transcript_10030/g.30678 Transcript_10030/m.30678 type:complete len:396 (+) Transcript_10030:492-1679(+)
MQAFLGSTGDPADSGRRAALLALLALLRRLRGRRRRWLRLGHHRKLAGLGLEDLQRGLNRLALDEHDDAPAPGLRQLRLVRLQPLVDALLGGLDVVGRGDLDGPDGHLLPGAEVHVDPDLALADLLLLEAPLLQCTGLLSVRCEAGGPLLQARARSRGQELVHGPLGPAHGLHLLQRLAKELRHEDLVDGQLLAVREGHLLELAHAPGQQRREVLLGDAHGLDLQQHAVLPALDLPALLQQLLLLPPTRALRLHLRLPGLHGRGLALVPALLELLHALQLVLLLDLHEGLLQRLANEHVQDGLDLEVEDEEAVALLDLRRGVDARLLRPVGLGRGLGQELVGLRLYSGGLDGLLAGDEVLREVHGHALPLGQGHVEDLGLLRPALPPRPGRGGLR